MHHSRLWKVNDQQDRGAVAENQSPNENDKKDTVTATNLPDVASNDMDTETDTGNGAETFNHATDNTVERSNEENIQQQPHVLRQHGCSNLKTGETVKYMDRESGIPHTATVFRRAGKANRKHQNWYKNGSALNMLHFLVQQGQLTCDLLISSELNQWKIEKHRTCLLTQLN